jgi:hypothetical protein
MAADGGKVRANDRIAVTAGLLLLWGAATAFADGVQVKIANNGTQDLVVTVYDTSTQPAKTILTDARINGFTSISVSLLTDATGKANVAWTATSVDATNRKCGHASSAGLADAGTVSVSAESACSTS